MTKSKKGFHWTTPRRLFSVRANQEESKMITRLARKLHKSQNKVLLEALARLYAITFQDPE